MRGAAFLLLLAALLATTQPAWAAEKPEIDNLYVRRASGSTTVSFQVVGGIPDELLERIHSGIPVTFRHRVDLVSRRLLGMIPSKVHARKVIHTRVEYDSLTRHYLLNRTTRIKAPHRKGDPDAFEDSSTTESLEEMRTWMTRIEDVELGGPPVDFEGKLKLRVESVLDRRYILLVFPSSVSASVDRKLEY